MRMKIKTALASAAALASLAAASPASAATIANASGVTLYTLLGGENLVSGFKSAVYLFNEGTTNGVTSYLLHYDRTLRSPQYNSGSFDIVLGANETFLGMETSAAGLDATDPANGVTYPDFFLSLRGLENSIAFIDSVATSGNNPIGVTFKFNTSLLARDEVRFLIGAAEVPEPSTWAMMILGIGFAGAALRRKRQTVSYNFA